MSISVARFLGAALICAGISTMFQIPCLGETSQLEDANRVDSGLPSQTSPASTDNHFSIGTMDESRSTASSAPDSDAEPEPDSAGEEHLPPSGADSRSQMSAPLKGRADFSVESQAPQSPGPSNTPSFSVGPPPYYSNPPSGFPPPGGYRPPGYPPAYPYRGPVFPGYAMQNQMPQNQWIPPTTQAPPSAFSGTPQSAQEDQDKKNSLFGSIFKSMLNGETEYSHLPINRPNWIPGYAFTNNSMVAPYHNRDILWWDKKPMPPRPQWIRLATSVTRYWRGYVQQPCMVFVEPLTTAPGNFVFHGRRPFEPHGWLQALEETDRSGFPLYRYWFDQR